MPKTNFPSTALPPPEVVSVIRKNRLSSKYIEGWYAIPSIRPPLLPLGTKHLREDGLVDAYALLKPLLGNKYLRGTLRTIDVLNGCGQHCDTCLADAAFPSKMFSFESLKKLFEDPRFLRTLQPDSLRFGSSGDITNHPDAIKIVKLALKATIPLNRAERKRSKNRNGHKVVVYTNYRPNLEDKLDQFISLAQKNTRFELVISLPLNKIDSVNKRFIEFVLARPQIFGKKFERYQDGMLDIDAISKLKSRKRIYVQDVRHNHFIFSNGRTLTKKLVTQKLRGDNTMEIDRRVHHRDRGLVKTYLNPDKLWLMIYATIYESHTVRVFTPLNPQNLATFSQLNWHSDFPIPPNWAGRKVKKVDYSETKKRLSLAKKSRRKPFRPTIVK